MDRPHPSPSRRPRDGASSGVPTALVVALALLGLESVALVLAAVVFVVDAVRGAAPDVLAAVALAVFFVGFALLLAAAGRALWRGQRWGRGPAVTWQLLLGASAVAMAGSLPLWLVVALLGMAAGTVVGVLWPSSREHASRTGAPGALP